jgi:5-methylcytosine-specific restriction endonuclease McrA
MTAAAEYQMSRPCTCVICHRHGIDLDIGHLVSVDEGRQAGLTDLELYDDENLAAMCAACNSGYSSRSINPRLLAALLRSRITSRGGETA